MPMWRALRQMPAQAGRLEEGRGEAESYWGSDEARRPRHRSESTGSSRHLNLLNRPVRTRMPGGVGGEGPQGSPLSRSCYKALRQTGETSPRKIMSANDNKTKTAVPKKEPAPESKTAEAAPKSEGAKSEGVKSDGVKTEIAKPDAVSSKRGMGEGQKPVTKAYKDNW